MHGQWIGKVQLTLESTQLILNIDADKPNEFMFHILGKMRAFGLLAMGEWNNNSIDLKPVVIYRQSADGDLIAPAENELTDEERAVRNETTVSLKREERKLSGSWLNKSGSSGAIEFPGGTAETCADPTLCRSWDDFKQWAENLRREHDTLLYRGHGSHKFRLQTALHRAGRFRLDRYWNEVVPIFRDRAESVMGVRFDKNDGDDQAIVLGLAQHHGLPTPMLDVTASPYVAAFFAFSDAIEMQRDAKEHSHVRVYAFTRKFSDTLAPPIVSLRRAEIFVHSLSVGSRFNPRLTAQQGRFLVTNVASMESLIRFAENQRNERVMFAADIPVALAPLVLQDLTFMGLTAASMFPGLDGIGKMMRHQMLFAHKSVPALENQSIASSAAAAVCQVGKK